MKRELKGQDSRGHGARSRIPESHEKRVESLNSLLYDKQEHSESHEKRVERQGSIRRNRPRR